MYFIAFLGRSEKVDSKAEACRHWDKGRAVDWMISCSFMSEFQLVHFEILAVVKV